MKHNSESLKKKSIYYFLIASLLALISAATIVICLGSIFLQLKIHENLEQLSSYEEGFIGYLAYLSFLKKIYYFICGIFAGLSSGFCFGAALDFRARSKKKDL